MQRQRILVTGGAGFIGRHLCARLKAEGHQVMILDNFSSSRRRKDDDYNAHWTIPADVVQANLAEILPSLYHHRCDRIYHLACPASPKHYGHDPLKTFRTCIDGTRNVLNLARNHRARVLIASTSEVYGDPTVAIQNEDYCGNARTWSPRACYVEGKRAAESLAWIYANRYAQDVRVARIFNSYGTGMEPDDGRLIPTLVGQIAHGETMTIHGDGRQTRSFCHVNDTVDGLIGLMDYNGANPGPVNIGDPAYVFPVIGLAMRIAALAGVRPRFKSLPAMADDPCMRRPDISLARRLFGFEPKVKLDPALHAIIAEARERFARPA